MKFRVVLKIGGIFCFMVPSRLLCACVCVCMCLTDCDGRT